MAKVTPGDAGVQAHASQIATVIALPPPKRKDQESAEETLAKIEKRLALLATPENSPGIIDHRSGKKQARLVGVKVDGKAYQRPIPGLFKNDEEAVVAQAVAQQKFDAGGVAAVWPPKNEERNEPSVGRCAVCSTASLRAAHLCVFARRA